MVFILQGLLLGLLVSASIGPSFFALVQIGIQRDFKHGISMSNGVILSDLVLIGVAYYVVAKTINTDDYNLIIGIIGGGILIAYGVYSIFRKIKEDPPVKQQKKLSRIQRMIGPEAGHFTYFVKGFFLNILNPITIFLWIGAVALVKSLPGGNENKNILMFFISCCICILVFNLLKVFLGKKIKQFLSVKILNLINTIIGIILILSGISVIFYAWFKL